MDEQIAFTDKRILYNCSFVKTFLMLLVMFGHAIAFWSEKWFTAETPIIKSIELSVLYSWIDSFHVYGFTLVSGYIFALKVLEGDYNSYRLFLRTKAKRLLVPYVFVMIIWVAPISYYFFKWDISYLIRKYLLCTNPSQLWFLWMLFWLFVIAWPLRKIMEKRPILSWIFTFTFYAIGILASKFISNYFCIWSAFRYMLYFNLGFRLRVKKEKEKRSKTYHKLYTMVYVDCF